MAGRIPQHFIDQLISRTDIVDLIDSYVPLKKAGANYKACCPFHGEKTPSFTVSPSKQFYHCFGCGANGTAIGFLMEYDHMEFREAVEKLAASAGLEIPEEAVSHARPKPQQDGIDLYELMTQASSFFQSQLRSHPSKQEAIDYLKQRGLSGEIAKRFDLGFVPDGWDNLMKALGSSAAAQKALLSVGMLTQNDKQRTYDRFRHRIMFPIHDHRGRVVGFGGRVLGSGEPKYLNSPETPIFHKGSELYGLYAARGAIKEAEKVLVVEGYMDVVALAQAGIDNAVATLGTATTPMHLQRLFRHTQNIVFCFDGDRAGRAAAWKALETSLPVLQDGYQVSFLFLPDGEDPDSMVRKIGKDALLAQIGQATPLPDFLLDTLKQQADLERLDGRAKLGKLAQPLINKLPNGLLKTLLAERVARLTELSPQALLESVKTTNAQSREAPTQPKQNRKARRGKPTSEPMTPIRRAISLLLQHPGLHDEFDCLAAIPNDRIRGLELLSELSEACKQNPNASTASLLERYREASFVGTLTTLANHHHNNMEALPDSEARELARATAAQLIADFNAAELTLAEDELDALNKKSQLTELTQEEQTRKASLSEFVRNSYKS